MRFEGPYDSSFGRVSSCQSLLSIPCLALSSPVFFCPLVLPPLPSFPVFKVAFIPPLFFSFLSCTLLFYHSLPFSLFSPSPPVFTLSAPLLVVGPILTRWKHTSPSNFLRPYFFSTTLLLCPFLSRICLSSPPLSLPPFNFNRAVMLHISDRFVDWQECVAPCSAAPDCCASLVPVCDALPVCTCESNDCTRSHLGIMGRGVSVHQPWLRSWLQGE